MNKIKDTASELEFLRFFRQMADFGPADYDVKIMIEREFEKKTGKFVPRKWSILVDEEEQEYGE